MYAKSLIVLAFTILGVAHAQVIEVGKCPPVNVKENFDVAQYLGDWYEYARIPNTFETDGKCNIATYTLQEDGNVGVKNTMINTKTGETESIEGYAVAVDNAKLKVVFPVTPIFNATSNYWVLDADYTNYSAVYSCQPVGPLGRLTYAWILTRERQPSAEVVEAAEEAFHKNGLSTESLKKTDQSTCN